MSRTQDGVHCPPITVLTLYRAMRRGTLRLDGHGVLERLCPTCCEWWPADTEFFHRGNTATGLHSYCRACEMERRARVKAEKEGEAA